MLRSIALLAVALLACDDRSSGARGLAPSLEPPVAASVELVDASDLLAKFECNRCHEVPGVAAAPRDKHCVTCHEQIHAGTFEAAPAVLATWRERITSIRWVPSLVHAQRFRRAWVRDYLLEPHDVRPGLVAQMPRLAIRRDEAERIAAHLVPSDLASPIEGDVARGEQLYRSLACGRCHRFTGTSVDDAMLHANGRITTNGSWALAPDLRHARVRVQPSQLAAWIVDPRGAMPVLGIPQADARALAAFITETPLAERPARAASPRLAVLDRAVTWDELEAKVFRGVCWHCHASPDLARGDGGPGNSGGFGFGPRGLDVSSYANISSGSLDDAGEPRSVFGAIDGTPRLVAHLLARHVEEAGGTVPGVRGMPLGLPALPLEQIQLVETWIAQGRSR